jgi:hypothetical protein
MALWIDAVRYEIFSKQPKSPRLQIHVYGACALVTTPVTSDVAAATSNYRRPILSLIARVDLGHALC